MKNLEMWSSSPAKKIAKFKGDASITLFFFETRSNLINGNFFGLNTNRIMYVWPKELFLGHLIHKHKPKKSIYHEEQI